MASWISFGIVIIGLLVAMGGGGYWYRKRCNGRRMRDFIFLQILIPKKESKEEQERERDQTSEIRKVAGIGEHFLASLYGIYSSDFMKKFQGQDFLSLEYLAVDGDILFCLGCPRELQDVIEKQITSFYPDAVIDELPPLNLFDKKAVQATGYLSAARPYFFPIKTYARFESTDPINTILNALSNASDENGNSAAIQIMIRPYKSTWQKTVRRKAKDFSHGKKGGFGTLNPLRWIGSILGLLMSGSGEPSTTDPQEDEVSLESQETIKAMEEKAEKVGFETIIRCVTSSPNLRTANVNLHSILNAFAQYGGPGVNEFRPHKWHSKRTLLKNFLWRAFERSWHRQNTILFSSEELASIYHFPHIKYNNIPGIKWQDYKIARAPSNIPKEGLLLGHNFYRGNKVPIRMKRDDRFRHFYVIGQTGTGKSSIMNVMARQDMENGDGLCIIDPHGSLIEALLPHVPKHRIDDVIIFDPSDLERPMGLNLLEAHTDEERDLVALDAMNIMIKLFDEEIFGPRIQDYFRNGCLTLMADPAGGSLTDIVRLFTDDAFQRSKVQHVTNPIVKSFWTNQMAQTGAREKAEMIPYFAAKFGAFITNSMMRNIIGQTKSAFDFSKCMEEGKILMMNLSKGATGEINSKLLGMIVVSKIQTAALRRQKQLSAGKKPRDFFLYIDEFQNYVTDSIESILSEARKYRLGLNIAHQYISQIDQSGKKGGANLKDAVFGNVGTMMCYKIGAQDAEHMAKEMAPVFSDQDLINIDKYKAVMKLSIDTQPSRPFSITPVNPYTEEGNLKLAQGLKQISRLTYGREKKFVEKEIFTRLSL